MSTLNVNDNPAAQADDGHDARGRFKAGNKGGPGNPFAGQVAGLRQAMLECVTKEEIQAVFKSLVELAKDGHWQAAKLVLAYTIGKPQPLAEAFIAAEWDTPLSPVLGGEGPGVRGPHAREIHPSPQPLSPEYRGEGLSQHATPSSPNGEIQEAPPSPNGEIQEAPPSTNGSPVLNRQERRALRKAMRLAKQQRNAPKPASAGPIPAN